MIEQDTEILCNIQKTLSVNPNATQRTLAHDSNISLGMMNAVLKRCAERGWIAIKNLNMKKVCYCLTSKGLEEISIRTSGYMKKSFIMMNEYANKICKIIEQEKNNGKLIIILVGSSKIEFVLEWACNKFNVTFEQRQYYDKIKTEEFVFCGENIEKKCLQNLIMQGALNIMEL